MSLRRPLLSLLVLLAASSVAQAAPDASPGLVVSAAPAQVVLGRDGLVQLEVRGAPAAGRLRAAASTGSFAEDVLDGGPTRTFTWRPPPVRHPQVALFLFWVETAGGASDVTTFQLPLLGQTTLDVVTAPGASVVVVVGDDRFGPVMANAQGKARVPLEVPPNAVSARVLATRGALRTDAATPLDVPRERPLVAALSPSPLVEGADGLLLVAGEDALTAAGLDVVTEEAVLTVEREGAVVGYRVRARPEVEQVVVDVRPRDAATRDVAQARADVLRRVAPPPPAPPVRPAPPPSAWRPSAFLLAGGAFANGSNTGPLGAVGVSVGTPWWHGRLAAELEVGLRGATFDGTVDSLGAVRSSVLAVPILVSVRAELLRGAGIVLYGRAGGGVAPFRHHLGSDFQEDIRESRLSGMGFLAIQGAYRLGHWSALGELRGSWAPASTPWLDAQLGGVAALVGARFEP
ncbi:hypothetical protein LZ198_10945 [Myxococcus sp. K15C18031901]|uniref:hypothetical protein n=1 Tax=Myxococcus dinghuensis TaxID=2906761 RepID=UPI0020A7783E|nr:hypothetical protein [Myxococcus dinghuensis]MCP3099386.1 hypothetical protein [Myxococcus dinghuensis]